MGLLVFGEEYSTITDFDSSVTSLNPNLSLHAFSTNSSNQKFDGKLRLRNPFTTLNSVIKFFFNNASPISFPISSGFFLNALRSEEHTSELQSRENLVCRLLL